MSASEGGGQSGLHFSLSIVIQMNGSRGVAQGNVTPRAPLFGVGRSLALICSRHYGSIGPLTSPLMGPKLLAQQRGCGQQLPQARATTTSQHEYEQSQGQRLAGIGGSISFGCSHLVW